MSKKLPKASDATEYIELIKLAIATDAPDITKLSGILFILAGGDEERYNKLIAVIK